MCWRSSQTPACPPPERKGMNDYCWLTLPDPVTCSVTFGLPRYRTSPEPVIVALSASLTCTPKYDQV
jgi:hypothetical protein